MIAIDSSVLVAIVYSEAGAEKYAAVMDATPELCVGAATLFEASMVVEGKHGIAARIELDALVAFYDIEIVPFDAAQMALARDAFARFGKSRHKAGLNFGDCIAYALAKSRDLPLLFKGADFAETDLKSAL